MKYNYVIVSHAGAGSHSKYKEDIYKDVCNRSCKAAKIVLNRNKSGLPDLLQAVVEAIKVLENDPCTNAGIGSNLSINGKLQCDASIMCGQSLRFAAIGAVSNIKNPILVAAKLLKNQIDEPLMKTGRYPPSVLVGSDATQYAFEQGIPMAKDEELITVEKQRKFEKYQKLNSPKPLSKSKRKGSHTQNEPNSKRVRQISEDVLEEDVEQLSDTVGVIIADSLGRVISATSSGGIFLKQDGRLGQSCMFGCGSYSEQKDSGISVTSVSTGLGEQLMRTLLPYKTCEAIGKWSFHVEEVDSCELFRTFLHQEFMQSPFLNGDVYKSFGILALRSQIIDGKMSLDFLCGHSTPSMCYAYLSSRDRQPRAVMSRKDDQSSDFVVGSMGECFNVL